LTGLGIAGLAASLAAQDAMKSYFGTLLLIGERTFKIGDRIIVNGAEGIVEQVGFRSTRLRTADRGHFPGNGHKVTHPSRRWVGYGLNGLSCTHRKLRDRKT
jgi:MscS family membrane protein